MVTQTLVCTVWLLLSTKPNPEEHKAYRVKIDACRALAW